MTFTVTITIIGWLVNNTYNTNRQINQKFLEIKNEKLYNSYISINTYIAFESSEIFNQSVAINFNRSLYDIQIYGSKKQIKEAEKVLSQLEKSKTDKSTGTNKPIQYDALLNSIRNDIRHDFKLEHITTGNFWVLPLKKPYVNTLAKPTQNLPTKTKLIK